MPKDNAVSYDFQGRLTKFSWLNSKKVNATRFFQLSGNKMQLFPSLYSSSLKNERPIEEIDLNEVFRIKRIKERKAGKETWRLFLFSKLKDKSGNKFDAELLNFSKKWIKIVQLFFEEDWMRVSFEQSYSFVRNNIS